MYIYPDCLVRPLITALVVKNVSTRESSSLQSRLRTPGENVGQDHGSRSSEAAAPRLTPCGQEQGCRGQRCRSSRKIAVDWKVKLVSSTSPVRKWSRTRRRAPLWGGDGESPATTPKLLLASITSSNFSLDAFFPRAATRWWIKIRSAMRCWLVILWKATPAICIRPSANEHHNQHADSPGGNSRNSISLTNL